ncbi:hypothetical protein [Streptosporangium carneum]|uniref:Peptidase inhibitor family I36 n=1 Tax=Streptosporangium carneum TaxID=47481 RepID=A0A9W6MEP2_9ACTN|nr:hypothetical protein [Streptosporangium carneum]GLK11396.1 hypothetical protein GCM10017600_48030 [Streptosporangium carneum]
MKPVTRAVATAVITASAVLAPLGAVAGAAAPQAVSRTAAQSAGSQGAAAESKAALRLCAYNFVCGWEHANGPVYDHFPCFEQQMGNSTWYNLPAGCQDKITAWNNADWLKRTMCLYDHVNGRRVTLSRLTAGKWANLEAWANDRADAVGVC